jgi:3-oxoacyl-[acyl-carrier-protein] synthase II
MKRVVVTGIGMVSPLGAGVEHSWRALLEGRSGLSRLPDEMAADLPCKVVGRVPRGEEPGQFRVRDVLEPKEQRRYGEFIHFALAAAAEALADSGYVAKTEQEQEATGVLVGSGIGGFPEIAENALILDKQGPRRISPYFIPGSLINEVSGILSIRYGFKGPNHSVVTACATGAHAIGDAARLIALGDAKVMIAGGTEAAICRLAMAGFCIMRAMSTSFNDSPEAASRPWDRARDGFVMSEGAGIVVLEELEHARARGAQIHAEVLGYGLSGDAYHLSAPDPEGRGAYRAMSAALTRAAINADQIGYINAHATSTPAGDPVELRAARRLFSSAIENVAISATKSSTGHLLGAAGAVEAIFSILALRRGVVPPTLQLSDPDEEAAGLNLVPRTPEERSLRYVLSNSFGFGGTNAALVFGRL